MQHREIFCGPQSLKYLPNEFLAVFSSGSPPSSKPQAKLPSWVWPQPSPRLAGSLSSGVPQGNAPNKGSGSRPSSSLSGRQGFPAGLRASACHQIAALGAPCLAFQERPVYK